MLLEPIVRFCKANPCPFPKANTCWEHQWLRVEWSRLRPSLSLLSEKSADFGGCEPRMIIRNMHGVWNSKKKSHSTLRAKRATFTFWVKKKFNEKGQKWSILASFWKPRNVQWDFFCDFQTWWNKRKWMEDMFFALVTCLFSDARQINEIIVRQISASYCSCQNNRTQCWKID